MTSKQLLTYSVLLVSFFSGGFFISDYMTKSANQPISSTVLKKSIDQYFSNAINYMQKKQYKLAVDEWQRLLELNSKIPEAYVNLGFSFYEMADYKQAKRNFQFAMDLNPYQANAYYGLAICLEKNSDIKAASGAMRSFIHLSKKSDPFLRKAESALWEWQAQLKNEVKQKSEQVQGDAAIK